MTVLYAVLDNGRRSSVTVCSSLIFFALIVGNSSFCNPINDAAKKGCLLKVKALIKDVPNLVFSKDDFGDTPFQVAALEG
jgi:ankyrin repeat protein